MSRKGHYPGGSTVFPDWSDWTAKGTPGYAPRSIDVPSIAMLRERVARLKKFGSVEEVKAANKVLAAALSDKKA